MFSEYIIGLNETINDISSKFGVPISEILKLNSNLNSKYIIYSILSSDVFCYFFAYKIKNYCYR